MNKNKPSILEVTLVWCFIAAMKKSEYRSLNGFCGYGGLKLKYLEEGFICGDDCVILVCFPCVFGVFSLGLTQKKASKHHNQGTLQK